MPQAKMGDMLLATGNATKDAELKLVGERKSAMTTFGMAVGKSAQQQTIYANCKAWRQLAEYASGIRKGDAVFAVGTLEEREYNGKIYKTLVCSWLDYKGKSAAAAVTGGVTTPGAFSDAQELPEDADLPF